jgi:THO complex subunit 5
MAVDPQVTDPSLASVLETSSSAREQALALVDLVAQAHAAAGDAPLSLGAQAEISRQQKLLTTNLSRLRGLHRAACFGARDTKGVTAEARQEVDRLHLQLQNLYYEQRHLEDEIQACESFEWVHHVFVPPCPPRPISQWGPESSIG